LYELFNTDFFVLLTGRRRSNSIQEIVSLDLITVVSVCYSIEFIKLGRIAFSVGSGGKGSWSVGPFERAGLVIELIREVNTSLASAALSLFKL
jgi:hypothetical protein